MAESPAPWHLYTHSAFEKASLRNGQARGHCVAAVTKEEAILVSYCSKSAHVQTTCTISSTTLSPDCCSPLQGRLLSHLQRSQSPGWPQARSQPTTQQTQQTFRHGSQSECASASVLLQLQPLPHPTQGLYPTHQRLHSSTSSGSSPRRLALQFSTSPTAASLSLCCTGCAQPSEAMRIQPWYACCPFLSISVMLSHEAFTPLSCGCRHDCAFTLKLCPQSNFKFTCGALPLYPCPS